MTETIRLDYLDAFQLARALDTGICHVVRSQESLNRINVFPVADGDTGTNLALTLMSVRGALERQRLTSVGALLADLADAIIDGARGNSGAILAQFFQGLSDRAIDLAGFSTDDFAEAVRVGSTYAREALTDPREGTVLSVASAFADALDAALRDEPDIDFVPFLERGVDAAIVALEKTPEQLEALRKAGVVDAGARGFVTLLEGMLAFLRDGEEPDVGVIGDFAELAEFVETAGEDVSLEYRYCTECIVTGENIDRRRLREALSTLGTSLVLAGTRNKARVHIHVNDPSTVFATAGAFGAVSAEKADDMHRQSHATHGRHGRTAIITDSSADIPDELLETLDIHVVPLRVHFGSRAYLDKLTISTREFFDLLRQSPSHPKTSQPAPGDFRRQYQFLATHFPDVVSISLTGTVSGTLNAAEVAAGRVTGPGRVRVVDSLNASVGQGLITIEAAECAAGGMPAEEIVARLQRSIPATRTFALVPDLEAAVRGGRVSAWVKRLADWLRVTPVLATTPDGRIKAGGALLGRGRRLAKFARFVARRASDAATYRIAIGHAQCLDDARELARLLSARLPCERAPYIAEIGAAIGVHGGAGTLVVAIQAR